MPILDLTDETLIRTGLIALLTQRDADAGCSPDEPYEAWTTEALRESVRGSLTTA